MYLFINIINISPYFLCVCVCLNHLLDFFHAVSRNIRI